MNGGQWGSVIEVFEAEMDDWQVEVKDERGSKRLGGGRKESKQLTVKWATTESRRYS